MSITDFMNEFNISNEDSIGFVISNKFIKKNSIDEDEIITKLEKYDIPVLKHIKKSMRKDSQDLYEKIRKRRDAYIDRERRIHEIKKEQINYELQNTPIITNDTTKDLAINNLLE